MRSGYLELLPPCGTCSACLRRTIAEDTRQSIDDRHWREFSELDPAAEDYLVRVDAVMVSRDLALGLLSTSAPQSCTELRAEYH